MKLYLFTESDHKTALKHLRHLIDDTSAENNWTAEIGVLAQAIEAYEKKHYPITSNDIPERRYYVFDPNNGEFVSGPMSCKNLAKIVCRDKQPMACAPEREPYVVVELKKDDIMLHKVDYRKKTV